MSDPRSRTHEALAAWWSALGGEPRAVGAVEISGPDHVLASVYDVTSFAAATVGVACLGVAEVVACTGGDGRAVPAVSIDRLHAAAAFRSEAFVRGRGWDLPALWDPIAGDYPTADGWVRLHTNYPHHRAAALAALGLVDGDEIARPLVAEVVATMAADEVERLVVEAGGAAATMRTVDAWRVHPQRAAVAPGPLVAVERTAGTGLRPLPAPASPTGPDGPAWSGALAGVRVLDLTRVIAGPVCTSFLAAHGADVLRVDPPGFDDVPALLVDTTAGKRTTRLDLRSADGRATFESLVAGADVLVCGYRAGSLDRLGLGLDRLRERNPDLVVALLDAYGWAGPWLGRRGFDSLVQMSTGIAARGQEVFGTDRPHPLPAQALDHGTGYLLAGAVGHALADRARTGSVATIRASLARTAEELITMGEHGDPEVAAPTAADVAHLVETVPTAWGALDRIRMPGAVAGAELVPRRPAGPVGRDPAAW